MTDTALLPPITIQDVRQVKTITEFEFRPKTEQLKALDNARREGSIIRFNYSGIAYEGRVTSISYHAATSSLSATVSGVAV